MIGDVERIENENKKPKLQIAMKTGEQASRKLSGRKRKIMAITNRNSPTSYNARCCSVSMQVRCTTTIRDIIYFFELIE